jgi:predicted transcriptional regulator
MILEVLGYLKKHREATISELEISLNIEQILAEAILEELISKGRVEKHLLEKVKCLCNCEGCTSKSCKPIEIYRLIKK